MANLYGPRIVTDGLVLHLDAGNRKSYPGSGSTWYDLSGNGNHGTFGASTAAPTFSSDNGGVLNFSNDYVNCGNSSSLNITSQITISAVLKCSIISQNMYVVAKHLWGSGYVLHYDTAYETFSGGGFQANNIVSGSQFEVGQNISADEWIFVTYTYNGTTEAMYYNGNLINSRSISGSINSSSGYNLYIGMGYGNGDFFQGKISIVNVYNRGLSANEVQQNYNATKGRFGL